MPRPKRKKLWRLPITGGFMEIDERGEIRRVRLDLQIGPVQFDKDQITAAEKYREELAKQ